MNGFKRQQHTVLSLNGQSFKNYLLLRYVNNATDPRWKRLSLVSEDLIAPEVWIQLHQYAKHDLESQGGKLIGCELVDEQLVQHESIHSNYWPTNWMWVIEKQEI